ncbi:hypothetical protein ACQPZ8_32505 [Actinomadura nitritigenes]|uniref:hypothetical protein n=1 Tax=Actinomadura nitritigenes TaxID=134602 RepID=UPI003D8B6A7D
MLAVLGFPHLQHTKALPLPRLLDVLELVLGTVASVGALFVLVMAYRRQRLAGVADDRDQQRALLDAHGVPSLRVRWEIRDELNEAFLALGCALMCWRRLRSLC